MASWAITTAMLDIYSDLTQQCDYFGGHIEMIEVEELAAMRREVNDADVNLRVAEFRTSFDVQADCPEEELRRAARTSIALDRLVKLHQLGSLAHYHKGVGSPTTRTPSVQSSWGRVC